VLGSERGSGRRWRPPASKPGDRPHITIIIIITIIITIITIIITIITIIIIMIMIMIIMIMIVNVAPPN
jgi:hypothetical protein